MPGSADETEQLLDSRVGLESSGLGPPSAALVWTGNRNLSPVRLCGGNHGWRLRHPAPECGESI